MILHLDSCSGVGVEEGNVGDGLGTLSVYMELLITYPLLGPLPYFSPLRDMTEARDTENSPWDRPDHSW